MAGSGFLAISQRIEKERSITHLGTASVRLDILHFPHSRVLDVENVERLKQLFRAERGCRPAEFANRIPAIIYQSQLEQSLEQSGISAGQLRHENPRSHARLEFPAGFRLECLRGRHRAKAAEEVFDLAAQRWIVDLYPADISADLRKSLIDEYSNERTPSHGEFFYKIREFQGIFGEGNKYFQNRWTARLASRSTYLADRLNQLIKHPDFGPAFDAFQHLPALYSGLRLSVINKVIYMNCHEEHLSFLGHVRSFFENLFDRNIDTMKKLDIPTLEAIQLKAPGACRADTDELKHRIRRGELFGAFTEEERSAIWTRLCALTTDCVVPSLYAFFEDRKWLEGPAICFKQLLNVKKGNTIRSALERAMVYERKPDGYGLTDAQWLDFAYRALWLYAIREYQHLLPRKKRKLANVKDSQANEEVLFRFASLADELGVKTKEVHDILQLDPDRTMARRFLREARRPDQYRYEDFEGSIIKMVNAFNAAVTRRGACDHGTDDEDLIDRSVESITDGDEIYDHSGLPRRSRLLRGRDQARDKATMFLAGLHSPAEKQGASLSSFFIQRSIYFAYIGADIDIPVEKLARLERDIIHTSSYQAERSKRQSHERRRTSENASDMGKEHSQRLDNLRREVLEQGLLQTEQQARIEELRMLEEAKKNDLERIKSEELSLRAVVEAR
ncbi:uncharacterized protein F4822DRAFT_441841 [Hypoxylon trugodes]|uniref:uncharacterized protein n=1 Tax=Hypoxylon trugodes TaxID=326681 RepID=UPI002193C5DB|nr:uncharacterized protein F4822DRAFT_441841 [Hypoxylon trugodes]KAI1382530.1 hypothetical protein F4822DRAFT_441841 [Hypoxylon trugodes]